MRRQGIGGPLVPANPPAAIVLDQARELSAALHKLTEALQANTRATVVNTITVGGRFTRAQLEARVAGMRVKPSDRPL